jgi:hypothetical protein
VRRPLLLLSLLLLAGCKDRLPHATKAELNTFLDGGVVMMDHVDWKLPEDQPVWPVETVKDVVSWLDTSFKGFGLANHDQVKQLLALDPTQVPRQYWDLIAFMHDTPTRELY